MLWSVMDHIFPKGFLQEQRACLESTAKLRTVDIPMFEILLVCEFFDLVFTAICLEKYLSSFISVS